MLIKRKIKFLLHTRKQGDAQHGKNLGIRLRVTYSGNSPLDFPLGLNVDAVYWDSEQGKVLDGFISKYNQNSSDINRTIDEYKLHINELFARYELLEKRIPDPQEVKDLFNDMTGKRSIADAVANETNVFIVLKQFTQSVGQQNQWSDDTYQKFDTLYKHLHDFDPNLTFPKSDETKMQDFVSFLLNKKGLRNTTVDKYISFVRWFYRWAAKKKYYLGDIHEDFRPRLKGTDGNTKEIIYFTIDEMKILYNFKFPEKQKYLERVRDVVLFCCFTGVRHSDAHKLSISDVRKKWLNVVTKKTNDKVLIDFNKYSLAILDKYKESKTATDKALPVISNQKMNDYLKELGQVVGLDETIRIVYFKGSTRHEEVYPKWALLTTHIGRRTFIITALLLGIPSEVIMKWTGHSDYNSLKPYVKIVDELKSLQMLKFNSINLEDVEDEKQSVL